MSTEQPYLIRVTHVDHFVTIQTLIHVGDVLVASYLPGTKHVETAAQVADEVIAAVFEPLFADAMDKSDVTRVAVDYPGGPEIDAAGYDALLDSLTPDEIDERRAVARRRPPSWADEN